MVCLYLQALNHLIEAIRKTEGEEGIIPALDRAKAHAKEAREQDASGSAVCTATVSVPGAAERGTHAQGYPALEAFEHK